MKKKIFYGWIITAAAFGIIGLGTFFTINAFGLFVSPIVNGLGVPVASVTLCATIMTFVVAITGSVAGKLVDLKGIKAAAITGSIALALALIVLGLSRNMFSFYIGYALMGIPCAILGPLLTSAVCAKWFVKYRGLANGIISAGAGFFATFCSPITAKLIVDNGYSKTYFLLLIPAFIVLVLSLIFLRNSPEDMGLLPDGEAATNTDKINTQGSAFKPEGLTLKEAVKTSGFWLVTIGFTVYMIGDLSIYQTYNANLQSIGFDPLIAAGVVSMVGLSSIPAKILYGFITDKISIKTASALGFLCLACAALLTTQLTSSSSKVLLVLFAVLMACGHGCWPILFMKYVIYTCGAKHIGSVYGAAFMIFNLGSMFGPVLAGAMYDAQGTYATAYIIFAACAIVALMMLMLVKKTEFNGGEKND